jgi:hypothetical protein
LDDSGKDPQNAITTVAGYVARAEDWATFEKAVEPVFAAYPVTILHATDLYHTEGEFAGWKVLQKQAFVYKILREMTPLVPLGVSMSALKSAYKERAEQSDRKRTVTPYTFCTNVIIDWILRDVRIGRLANTEGLSFVLECGHENNAEAEQNFYAVRKQHGLEAILHSISFVPKINCRAIQMADLLAFYSRRHGVQMERTPAEDRATLALDPVGNIIAGAIPTRAFVATDFDNPAWEPRF